MFLALPALSQLSTPQAVSGEYIIKFKNKTSVSRGLKVVGKMGGGVSVKAVFAGSDMMHVKLSSASERAALLANPDVAFVEPNYILSVNPVDVGALGVPPEDSDRYTQSDANVKVRDSWSIQKPYNEGSKTVVAVIDTGLDRNHLLFKDSGSIWENMAEKNGSPGVDDDHNGLVDDINGWNYVSNNSNVNDDNHHGTHVAGIVLGVGQDIFASPVRESKIKIMALKFLDASGSGSTSSAISAIEYAISKGARVINNSWGGPSYSQALHEAYVAAYNASVVMASAAGNSATNNDVSLMYPANFDSPNNISVLATTDSDNKASFSNYGATTVNIGAPGFAIISSVPGAGCSAPGCFQVMSGTSMAAPFVAGLAALAVREAPQLSAYQIRGIILGSVDIKSGLAGKVSTGGRVNAYKAIIDAQAQAATPAWSPGYSIGTSARNPASDGGGGGGGGSSPAAGCGLVKAVIDGSSGGGGFGGGGFFPAGFSINFFMHLLMLLLMLLAPVLIAVNLRLKSLQQSSF